MFKPHFQDATATAIIEGLAVSKYNHGASKWNVVFLRNCGHYPRLIIREVERRSGRVVSEIKRLEIAERDSISITVSSPAGNIPWIYQTDGPFNRNPSHDAQDFRWMLDIQQLHGREVPRTGSIPTNSLSISNGCFYTSVRTKRPYRKRWINPDGTETPIQEIGLTGRTFGADFKAASVTVRVTGENDYNGTFDHRDNSKYEIIFDNTCVDERQPSPNETDFHFYYKLFSDRNGRVEILPPEEPDVVAYQDPEPEPEPKHPACHAIDDGSLGG
jgi:hypothetical protein